MQAQSSWQRYCLDLGRLCSGCSRSLRWVDRPLAESMRTLKAWGGSRNLGRKTRRPLTLVYSPRPAHRRHDDAMPEGDRVSVMVWKSSFDSPAHLDALEVPCQTTPTTRDAACSAAWGEVAAFGRASRARFKKVCEESPDLCRLGSGRGVLHWRPAVTPPSTGRTAPVIQEACSDARKRIASATSPGWPFRPRGCRPL